MDASLEETVTCGQADHPRLYSRRCDCLPVSDTVHVRMAAPRFVTIMQCNCVKHSYGRGLLWPRWE